MLNEVVEEAVWATGRWGTKVESGAKTRRAVKGSLDHAISCAWPVPGSAQNISRRCSDGTVADYHW